MKLAEHGLKEVAPDLIFDLVEDFETFIYWIKTQKIGVDIRSQV